VAGMGRKAHIAFEKDVYKNHAGVQKSSSYSPTLALLCSLDFVFHGFFPSGHEPGSCFN
jgi:hypothetical protein